MVVEMDVIEIYTDGAKRGKPGVGPDSLAAAGWYCPVLADNPVVKVLGQKSNNFAEYEGLIMALEHVTTQTEWRHVRVITDSQLLQRQMTGVYRVNDVIRPQFEKAFTLSLELDYFDIVHVRGHSGNVGNETIDKALNDALDVAQGKVRRK